jgi:hypothetical protein
MDEPSGTGLGWPCLLPRALTPARSVEEPEHLTMLAVTHNLAIVLPSSDPRCVASLGIAGVGARLPGRRRWVRRGLLGAAGIPGAPGCLVDGLGTS